MGVRDPSLGPLLLLSQVHQQGAACGMLALQAVARSPFRNTSPQQAVFNLQMPSTALGNEHWEQKEAGMVFHLVMLPIC